MSVSLSDLTQQMLDVARAAGADACDAIAVSETSSSVDVRAGALEQAERAEGVEIGLRVFVGQKQACVSSSDTRTSTLQMMAERAVAMAREAPEDPYAGLADGSQLATDIDSTRLDQVDPSPEPDPAVLQAAALDAEAAALAVDGVSQVQSASAQYDARQIHLSASNGFSGGYHRTDWRRSCVAISGHGTEMERDYDYDFRTHGEDLRSPEDIGQSAAERAVSRAGARRPRTGSFPVIFDQRIAADLIGHLLQASNGAMITRGSSWLRDRVGQQVLPKALSIVENPHRPRAAASRLFDAEGLATSKRAIVEDGVLTGFTLDLATGRKLGSPSTANAARNPGSPPVPSLTNVALTLGSSSRDALLKDMGTGLLITSMIGSTINHNSGDYSRGASGYWVENGEITYPVNECTVAGNLSDMMSGLVPANDAKQHLSRVVPSLLIEGLTIAGE